MFKSNVWRSTCSQRMKRGKCSRKQKQSWGWKWNLAIIANNMAPDFSSSKEQHSLNISFQNIKMKKSHLQRHLTISYAQQSQIVLTLLTERIRALLNPDVDFLAPVDKYEGGALSLQCLWKHASWFLLVPLRGIR